MRRQLSDLVPVAVAIGSGLVVLLHQFVQNDYLAFIAGGLVLWAGIVSAIAVLLGLGNVLAVHLQRLARREAGAWSSIVILIVALVVFIVVLASGEKGSASGWVLQYLYQPLETAFLALLVFLMATAAYRALRVRSWESAFFALSAAIVLLGAVPIANVIAPYVPLPDVHDWIMNVPVVAGVRGILLGVALGVIATGLRLLTGIDRPYTD